MGSIFAFSGRVCLLLDKNFLFFHVRDFLIDLVKETLEFDAFLEISHEVLDRSINDRVDIGNFDVEVEEREVFELFLDVEDLQADGMFLVRE